MENPAKRRCIDLTRPTLNLTQPTLDLTQPSHCCRGHTCDPKRKSCIRRYFITKDNNNKVIKQNNNEPKLFESQSPVVVFKKEETDCLVIEEEEDNNVNDVQEIVFDSKYESPSMWPDSLTELEIDYIVDKGPVRPDSSDNPKEKTKYRFTEDMYCKSVRGESVDRRWLVYCKEKDALFCFPCKLFRFRNDCTLCTPGFSDWRYARRNLLLHEKQMEHVDAMSAWIDREISVKNAKPKIDTNVIELS